MKALQNRHRMVALIAAVMLAACIPCRLHAQVITTSNGASITISDQARIVLSDEFNRGHVGCVIRPARIEDFIQPFKRPELNINNVLIKSSAGEEGEGNGVMIFLDKAPLSFKQAGTHAFAHIYPNPTTDRFTFTITSDRDVTETVILQSVDGYEMERKLVSYKAGLNIVTWNMGRYLPETYLLVFVSAPGRTLKIVKQ